MRAANTNPSANVSPSPTNPTPVGPSASATSTVFGMSVESASLRDQPTFETAVNNNNNNSSEITPPGRVLGERAVTTVRPGDGFDNTCSAADGSADSVAPVCHRFEAALVSSDRRSIIAQNPENALRLPAGRQSPPTCFASSETIFEPDGVASEEAARAYLEQCPPEDHPNSVDGRVWLLMKEVACHSFSMYAEVLGGALNRNLTQDVTWPARLFDSSSERWDMYSQRIPADARSRAILDLYVGQKSELRFQVRRRSQRFAFLRWVAQQLDEFKAYAQFCGLSDRTLAPLHDVRRKIEAMLALEWQLRTPSNHTICLGKIRRELGVLADPAHIDFPLPGSMRDQIKVGQEAYALLDPPSALVELKIESIDPSVDAVSGTIQVRMRFVRYGDGKPLRPGSRASVLLAGSGIVAQSIPIQHDIATLHWQLVGKLLGPTLRQLEDNLETLPDLSGEQLLDIDGLARRFRFHEQSQIIDELSNLVGNIHRDSKDNTLDALCLAIEEWFQIRVAYIESKFDHDERDPIGFRAARIKETFDAFLPDGWRAVVSPQNASDRETASNTGVRNEDEVRIIAD
jgi:hypothetical protein